jgi:ornithine carbamoyltransferase
MFYGRSFLTLMDYSSEEIGELINIAARLKKDKKAGIRKRYLDGRNIALIFEKTSTRTRCAFAVAAADLGAHSDYLGKSEIQLGSKESVEDTARVLGRMYDAIEFRGFLHKHAELLARYSGVPVFNGLTDDEHPTQALADLMTINERFGALKGARLAYAGDGRNNVANALMTASAKMGLDYVVITPESLAPPPVLLEKCRAEAAKSGAKITVTSDLSAVSGANAVYTDVWTSMGEEAKKEERRALLSPYQVNAALMSTACKNAVFLHCLPAVKGEEVTEDVFEGGQSAVFDEAENRLHTIKAVILTHMVKDYA